MNYTGLTKNEVEKRFQEFGPNEIVRGKKMSAVVDFLLRFKNPLVVELTSSMALPSGVVPVALMPTLWAFETVVLAKSSTIENKEVSFSLVILFINCC